MADHDAELRRIAHESLARRAASVDVNAARSQLDARLGSPSDELPTSRHRWVAAAAAAALVSGGVTALALTRGDDDAPVVAPPPPSATPAPDTRGPGDELATAEPATARVGETVTITPAGTITRNCDDIVSAYPLDWSSRTLGLILGDTWAYDPVVDATQPPCLGETTADPLTFTIPSGMPPGRYGVCIDGLRAAAACAVVTVSPGDAAWADPPVVLAGDPVTITPAGAIERFCNDIVSASPVDWTGDHEALIMPGGRWYDDPVTGPTVPACMGATTADPLTFDVPIEMPSGRWELCIGVLSEPDGCAVVTVVAEDAELATLPLPTTTPTTNPGTVAPPSDLCQIPVAPPTLGDGSATGDVSFTEQGWAAWGAGGSGEVQQQLGVAPNSWWFDDPNVMAPRYAAGAFTAIVGAMSDSPAAPRIVLLRGGDACDRQYVLPDTTTEAADTLAQAWVDLLAGASEPAQAPTGYLGKRGIDEPPYFAIDGFDQAGEDGGTFADFELQRLITPPTLASGDVVALAGEPLQARCENLPLLRRGESGEGPLNAVARVARSFAVANNGVVVATRDVCEGVRWGEPGSRHEVIAFDASDVNSPVEVLYTVPADPSTIAFDDGNVVIAMGELHALHVSFDARWIAVQEVHHPDRWRYHVIDRQQPGRLAELRSSCEIPGDIVAPPRWATQDTLVVARVCATVVPTSTLPLEPLGEGDIHVDVIDPSGGTTVTQTWSVPGLRPNSYTHAAALSVGWNDGHLINVILTAAGGVEQPSRSFLFDWDGRATEISLDGYVEFAFRAEELIHHWDASQLEALG